MPKHPVTWIAVADGAQARILTTTNGREFAVVEELASADAHTRSHDLVSDRSGRGHESMAPSHHAIEARHDPHMLAKQTFLRDVAYRLLRAANEQRYERLVLVAPSRQLGDLRGCLDDQVRKKVTIEHVKDLTNLPLAELSQRLAALFQPQ
ncbi:MAG TPA: host attachment protein [Candidatus Sulfotelmatobacter sp.]|nr:host attachment protein [Candidatus Sulfotelmatobacter sp.]